MLGALGGARQCGKWSYSGHKITCKTFVKIKNGAVRFGSAQGFVKLGSVVFGVVLCFHGSRLCKSVLTWQLLFFFPKTEAASSASRPAELA